MKLKFNRTIEEWQKIDDALHGRLLTTAIESRVRNLLSKFNATCTPPPSLEITINRHSEIYDEDLSRKIECISKKLGIKPVQFIEVFILSQIAEDQSVPQAFIKID